MKAKDAAIAKQIEQITKGSYLHKTFLDLDEAVKRQDELQEQAELQKERKASIEAGKKALYQVRPLELDFLRERQGVEGLEASIKTLSITIESQTANLAGAKTIYEREKATESKREELSANISRLTKLLPQYDAAEDLGKKLAGLQKTQEQLVEALKQLATEKSKLTEEKAELTKELESLSDLDVQSLRCEQEAKQLKTKGGELLALEKSLEKLQKLTLECAGALERFEQAETTYRALQEEYFQKEKAFFREQAGVLAASLQDNEPCPVCGSRTHPHKAIPDPKAPSEAELHQLKAKVESARQTLDQSSKALNTKQTEEKEAEKQLREGAKSLFPDLAGDTAFDQLAEEIALEKKENAFRREENETLSRQIQSKLDRKKQVQGKLSSIEANLQTNEGNWEEKNASSQALASTIAEKSGQLTTLRASLEYGDQGEAQKVLQAWQGELSALREAFRKAEEAFQDLTLKLETNQALLKDQGERLVQATKAKDAAEVKFAEKRMACGFIDDASYQSALRNEEQLKELKGAASAYEREVQSVDQDYKRLRQETKDQERPDLAVLEELKGKLEGERQQVDQALQKVTTRLGVNEPIRATVQVGLEEVAGCQREYLLLSNLAKTANGELSGKQKLAFEQYVQAFYFTQILFEANKRLKIMTNSRFELLRREEAADLRSQTGLEIDVLDHYTGRVRSVKSLSGGESFKASLSLALGLSDVIQSTAGGVEINTLFVDEGFGSLDAESLEQAIQTLVGLAEGNRLIGIISHVDELKERIDRQIVIEKTTAGSTLGTVPRSI